MFDDKQLNILVKALNCSIDSREKDLEQYDGYLSMEEQMAFKKQIEGYTHVKMDIELEIGNRAIEDQMG